MFALKHFLKVVLLCWIFFISTAFAEDNITVPILVYHNFNPTIPGSMTITPAKFESQVKWLKDNGYTIVPLTDVVSYLEGKKSSLPEKPVVISADDGWESQYTYMWPIVRKYQIPVTLFIYPQTISQGTHAMTWDQLKELQTTGFFDIESHTYWHPNFKQEKRKLSQQAYEHFVQDQLTKSKKILEDKMGKQITVLAWPFGIYDSYLEQQAAKAGYIMAFSIDARHANKDENAMSQPRYMIVEGLSQKTFEAIMKGHAQGKRKPKQTMS